MAVTVIDTIKPKNDGDFPVLEDVDLQGGFRVVADATERDAIPVERRKEGMLVYQLDEKKYYKLTTVGDWEEAKMGADVAIEVVSEFATGHITDNIHLDGADVYAQDNGPPLGVHIFFKIPGELSAVDRQNATWQKPRRMGTFAVDSDTGAPTVCAGTGGRIWRTI